MTRMLHLFLLACFAACCATTIINRDVQRTVDASTPIIRMTTTITAINVQDEYILSFPTTQAKSISYLSAVANGENLRIDVAVSKGNITVFVCRAMVASSAIPSTSNGQTTIRVLAVITDQLTPFPATIKQGDNQFFIFSDSHYFVSPYQTDSQKSVVKLGSTGIESFTRLAPTSSKGQTITFGPYSNIRPFSYSKAEFHFAFNGPCAKITSFAKEVEVSHWGRVSVEEVYELKHCGPTLETGFSRYDYQFKQRGGIGSYRQLVTKLPPAAANIYYRDQIGNISTSELRRKSKKEYEMEILTRFPLFGGWQTQFYIGYTLPTESFLLETVSIDEKDEAILSSGNHFGLSLTNFTSFDELLVLLQHMMNPSRLQLKVDMNTGFSGVWVQQAELKVILPEGCSDIRVETPYPVEERRSTRFTYLDSTTTGGRPVVILSAHNLVAQHNESVTISYTFTKSRMLVEPSMLITSFMVLFLIPSLLARMSSLFVTSRV